MPAARVSLSPLKVPWVLALCAALLLAGCQRKKPIVVGAKSGPAQALLAEIVAQHLEARLPGIKVERRPGTGGTPILFQAIAGGDISIYADTTGAIAGSILKEPASPDPAVLLQRVQLELARIAQLDLIPLGYDDGPAVVIPATADNKEVTLSDAAQGQERWKLAMTPEFEQSSDFQALNSYHLPLAAPLRTLDTAELFDALAQHNLNMVVTTATDGHLATADWRMLQDDRKAFPSQQVCLMARQDRLSGEPGLRAALQELSGKLTVDVMRKLNRQIEIDHADARTVAREFLSSADLR